MTRHEKIDAIALTFAAEYGKDLEAVQLWALGKRPEKLTRLASLLESLETTDRLPADLTTLHLYHNMRLVYEDRLVSVWEYRSDWRKTVRRGKRVAASCPLTLAERRSYVKDSPGQCIRKIMDGRGLGLAAAARLVNEARGGSYSECKARFRGSR